MAGDLDRIRTELGAIAEKLVTLPDDAFAERSALRRRQQELRVTARAQAGAAVPVADLRARLAELERRQDELFDEARMNPGLAGVGGEGGGGIEPVSLQRINAAIDESYGRPALEEEIRAIRAELRRREEAS